MPRLPTLAIVVLLCVPTAGRAGPVEDLLQLVSPDAAMTVVIRDLKTHARAVAGSPFVKWLDESPLGRQFADPKDRQKLQEVEKYLTAQLGLTTDQLLDDIFGDAIAFAYQPGPGGKPEGEAGVFLVRARNPELLAKFVDGFNRTQQESGELKAVAERTHRDRVYRVREKPDGGREFFYVNARTLAFSEHEPAIRAVIDRELSADRSASAVAAGIARLGLADRLAVCWFAPRLFDAELAAKAESAPSANEKAFLTEFRKVWAATDGVALYAHPDRGLEVGVAVSTDPAKLPAATRDVLFPPTGEGGLGGGAPADAMIAAGGRVHVPKLVAAVESYLPANGRAGFRAAIADGLGPLVGKDKLDAVLAGIGPQWAAWAAPPATGSWVPRWAVTVGLADAARRPVAQAMESVAHLIRLDYNRKHADQIELVDTPVKHLTNPAAFPDGFRPAYSVTSAGLVIASAPEAVPPTGSAPPATDPPVIRVNAARLGAFLADHTPQVTAALVRWTGRPRAEIAAELFAFGVGLAAFERIELRHTADDGNVRVWLTVEFVKPLK
jgi:hypothetical protein